MIIPEFFSEIPGLSRDTLESPFYAESSSRAQRVFARSATFLRGAQISQQRDKTIDYQTKNKEFFFHISGLTEKLEIFTFFRISSFSVFRVNFLIEFTYFSRNRKITVGNVKLCSFGTSGFSAAWDFKIMND